MNNDVKKHAAQPQLELKHMIWILDWAREACADRIEKLETKWVRNEAFAVSVGATKYGYRDRATDQIEITRSINEYRRIYDWIDVAIEKAKIVDNERFAQDMAAYFQQNRKKGG